jgi:hypothetical protein
MILFTLVYVSIASQKMTDDDLLSILKKSREYNQAHGITGLLLLRDHIFIQVLEGEEDEIESLYEKIRLDPRHYNPLLIFKREIPERRFGEWAMGFETPNLDSIKQIPGFSDCIQKSLPENMDDFTIMFEDELTRLLYPFRRK